MFIVEFDVKGISSASAAISLQLSKQFQTGIDVFLNVAFQERRQNRVVAIRFSTRAPKFVTVKSHGSPNFGKLDKRS